MAAIEAEKHIGAPIDTVFRFASDFVRKADYLEGVIKSEVVTDGEIGVGTRFRETRVMFRKEHTEEQEVVDFDPPNGYTVNARGCGCIYDTRWDFRASDGGTVVKFTFRAIPQGVFARIMMFLTGWMMGGMKKLVAKDLDDLGEAVLADSATT